MKPPPIATEVSTPLQVFTRGVRDARAAVHALPGATHAFRAPGGIGVIAQGVAWVPLVDRVIAAPMPSSVDDAPSVSVQGDRVVIETVSRCLSVEEAGWELSHRAHVRVGADGVLRRRASLWSSESIRLTDGAMRAADACPFPAGRGVVWSDSGWVYRQAHGAPPVPVVAIGRGERVFVGPLGAVAVCGEDGVDRVAAPGRSVVRLAVPLDAGGPVRFSPDGARIAGLDGPDVVVSDMHDGTLVAREPGALLFSPDELAAPGDDATLAWMSCAPAWDEAHIGGPEGAIWSFATGTRTTGSLLGPGPTAATSAGWATCDGRRRVRWVDPSNGASLAAARIPDGSWVEARADGAAAYFRSAEHRWLRVTAAGAVDDVHDAPPAPHAPTPSAAWATLGAQACLSRHGRLWLWSAAGLLMSTA